MSKLPWVRICHISEEIIMAMSGTSQVTSQCVHVANLLDTVELFNWKTHEQCDYPAKLPIALSEQSGAVIDGVPVVCGGFGNNQRQRGCYKLDDVTNSWQAVSMTNICYIRPYHFCKFSFQQCQIIPPNQLTSGHNIHCVHKPWSRG